MGGKGRKGNYWLTCESTTRLHPGRASSHAGGQSSQDVFSFLTLLISWLCLRGTYRCVLSDSGGY